MSAKKKDEDQRPILSQSLHEEIDQDTDEKLIENWNLFIYKKNKICDVLKYFILVYFL